MGILSWGERMTDGEIREIFGDTEDFIARELHCGDFLLYAYAVDGMVSGSEMSDYIVKPISENLRGSTMQELYDAALGGAVYNSVADACDSLQAVSGKLVGGSAWCCFPVRGQSLLKSNPGPGAHPRRRRWKTPLKAPRMLS